MPHGISVNNGKKDGWVQPSFFVYFEMEKMNVKEADLLFLKAARKSFAKNGLSRGKNENKRRKCGW